MLLTDLIDETMEGAIHRLQLEVLRVHFNGTEHVCTIKVVMAGRFP